MRRHDCRRSEIEIRIGVVRVIDVCCDPVSVAGRRGGSANQSRAPGLAARANRVPGAGCKFHRKDTTKG
jgi:hypothetical protein